MEETKRSYEELIRIINSMGSIKEIINSKDLLLQLLTYDGDRHLIAVFYEMLNQSIERGDVLPEDLENLRSGWLADMTIHLKDNVRGRNLYPFEIGDKINYMSLTKDLESQIATFTRPEIIGAIAGISPNSNGELSYCQSSFYSLSIDARLRIVEEIFKTGNIEMGMKMLNDINLYLEREREYHEERGKKVPSRW